MEKILYFDCFSGISGDMCLGALIDLGLDSDTVMKELNKLGIKGFDIKINKTNKYAISGIDVKVTIDGSGDCVHEDHTHGHDHSHGHGHTHSHDEKERNLADISHIIQSSGISQKAKDMTMAVFAEIAGAEAAVHGKLIDEIHFHEVGAIDSIVDIAGTAICLDMLNADRIICSPVHEGHGFIYCSHGKLPVPVPAVMKMLENSGIPVVTEDIEAELVTPTGFGILKTVAESCGQVPKMMVESVGYGFGKTDTGSFNALRVILGYSEEKENDTSIVTDNGNVRETVTLLETNIDNTTGEMMGYAMERLMKAGALDSWLTPVHMKKNRPAFILSVLCKRSDAEKLSDIIFMETSTIGIRIRETERIALKREISLVKTELGEARVKEVSVGGHLRIQPEYEDCARLAEENNLSINEVYEIVKRSHNGKEFGKNI